MSQFRKWKGAGSENAKGDKPLFAVMLVSRKKDNVNVEGYEQRREVYLTTDVTDKERLKKEFHAFVSKGVPGEMSRMYVSCNPRSQEGTRKSLMHYLVDNEDVNMAAVMALAVRYAMQKENAAGKRRMFDFDVNDQSKVDEFVQDLKDRGMKDDDVDVHKTPNGYAVVANRGADMRGLVDTMPDTPMKDKKDKGPWKWTAEEVGYKPDDMLLLFWGTK